MDLSEVRRSKAPGFSRLKVTWLTSEPLLKVKLLASLLKLIWKTKKLSLLIKVHIETQTVNVLRANQKNAKVKGPYLPLASREWKNGSNSSYNCTPFLHSLLTKGKLRASGAKGFRFRSLGFKSLGL